MKMMISSKRVVIVKWRQRIQHCEPGWVRSAEDVEELCDDWSRQNGEERVNFGVLLHEDDEVIVIGQEIRHPKGAEPQFGAVMAIDKKTVVDVHYVGATLSGVNKGGDAGDGLCYDFMKN